MNRKRTDYDEIAAPAYWASFLINGDDSGLDETERNAAAEYFHGLDVVSCGDEYIGRFHGVVSELVDYVVVRPATYY